MEVIIIRTAVARRSSIVILYYGKGDFEEKEFVTTRKNKRLAPLSHIRINICGRRQKKALLLFAPPRPRKTRRTPDKKNWWNVEESNS